MSRDQARPTDLMASPDLQITASTPVAPALVKHTCNDGHGPFLGRKTPGCPRCDELFAGAATRSLGWVDALNRRQRNDEADRRSRALHYAPDGPHATGACGPICTFGDW